MPVNKAVSLNVAIESLVTTPDQYIKSPGIVTAFQYDGVTPQDYIFKIPNSELTVLQNGDTVKTLLVGDWIITDDQNNISSMNPDAFDRSYIKSV